MGLPKNTSCRVGWHISGQWSLEYQTSIKCDKFLSKLIQLKYFIIKNKIENLSQLVSSRNIGKRNVPFILKRWKIIKDLKGNLYKWDLHPDFSYQFSTDKAFSKVDSGILARECGNLNRAFINLTSLKKVSDGEIRIYILTARNFWMKAILGALEQPFGFLL